MSNSQTNTVQFVSVGDFHNAAEKLAKQINCNGYNSMYGVPRGGTIVALELQKWLQLPLVSTPPGDLDREVLVVDDIVDSGSTRAHFPHQDFAVLHNKRDRAGCCITGCPTFAAYSSVKGWVQYWWEQEIKGKDETVQDNIKRILQYIGEDVEREGLEETPDRVVRSFAELYGGYKQDPSEVLCTFHEGSCDEMVVLKDVEFYSTCEHHMLPFFGKAHIAYIPNGRVAGISKLARLLEVFTRRLQIQERICQQVTNAMDNYLTPLGSACILEAQHLCMTARGIQKQNSVMVTSSLTGAFKRDEKTRSELMRLIGR